MSTGLQTTNEQATTRTERPIPGRPGRKPIDPSGESEARLMRLPAAEWHRLDLLAADLSRVERRSITAQEIIRRTIKYGSLKDLAVNVAEMNLAKKLAEVLKPYGLVIARLRK